MGAKLDKIDRARELRANMTEAERRLWSRLRHRQLHGHHFRRQVPIGPYVADFACLASRLVVEVDVSQHDNDLNRSRDDKRTRWLESEGYRVIRFWNNDVTQNALGVLDVIYAALYSTRDSEPRVLKHRRIRTGAHPITPPRRATRADPPPPGEGETGPAAQKAHP